jgi:hypothetical protein
MNPEFHEDLIAELAAINTVLIKCMSAITLFAEREGVPAKVFLENHLRSGEAALAKTDYWSIPEDRKDVLIEKARHRLTDIFNAVHLTIKTAGK